MAAALRQLIHTLQTRSAAAPGLLQFPVLLAWGGMLLVLLPLLPGLWRVLAPGLTLAAWQALLQHSQFPAALAATLFSATASTLLALGLACWLLLQVYPGRWWERLQRRLPLLLAFPHAAFAIGLGFLFAPSGWLARLFATVTGLDSPPQWVTVQDPYALSLTLVLALKESAFLLWVLTALLNQPALRHQLTLARTLGYGRRQAVLGILLPQLLPRLGWPLLAVFAYGLSVVDMALILGPTTPPTLAVLGSRWFVDPDPTHQAMASALALLLLLVPVVFSLPGRVLLRCGHPDRHNPDGVRRPVGKWPRLQAAYGLLILPGWAALLLLGLWSLAQRWFFPALLPTFGTSGWLQADPAPLLETLRLGSLSVLIALPLALLWLEWGPKRQGWLYFPLILPALPLAAAQYQVLLPLQLDHTLTGVVWSHLAWVLPYMILVLNGAYRAFDARYLLTARALGLSRWRACLRVKWPMLLRPLLAATAVGFAVSVAQYLPTLFAGGGRFETVTTEAVALSAGGNRRTLAIQALLQVLLPLAGFALAAAAGWLSGRRHRGLH
ncbi:MAG: ABC transporter permease subunit [Thiothrix sp.]|nr:ABC transporter permease subunit [Thiothrix sp.]